MVLDKKILLLMFSLYKHREDSGHVFNRSIFSNFGRAGSPKDQLFSNRQVVFDKKFFFKFFLLVVMVTIILHRKF